MTYHAGKAVRAQAPCYPSRPSEDCAQCSRLRQGSAAEPEQRGISIVIDGSIMSTMPTGRCGMFTASPADDDGYPDDGVVDRHPFVHAHRRAGTWERSGAGQLLRKAQPFDGLVA